MKPLPMIPEPVPEPPASTNETASIVPDAARTEELKPRIIDVIRTVFDPEIPVNIYELGLIYKIDVADNKDIAIDMTLTAPGCPVAAEMPGWVKEAVSRVPGVGEITVNMVFDPPWTPQRMSDEAKLELNMF